MLHIFLLISCICASCIFQLGGAVFDFSRLIGQDLKYKIGQGPGFYRVSVCSDLMDPCMNGFAPTATPQFGSLYRYQTGALCEPINIWNPMNLMIAPLSPTAATRAQMGTGVTFLFTDPTACNGMPMLTQYNMMCNLGSDTGHISVSQVNPCGYVVNWPTKYACAIVAPGTMPKQSIPQTLPNFPMLTPQSFPPQSPSIPVTEKPVFSNVNSDFFGDFLGNAICAEPAETCFQGSKTADIQLECKSCRCAIVMVVGGQFFNAKIDADVCGGHVLAGSLRSKEGLDGYIYLHSYHSKHTVKGTLDIEPYQSSKWNLKLHVKGENPVPTQTTPVPTQTTPVPTRTTPHPFWPISTNPSSDNKLVVKIRSLIQENPSMMSNLVGYGEPVTGSYPEPSLGSLVQPHAQGRLLRRANPWLKRFYVKED